MMRSRSLEKELLDADEIPSDDLRQNLRELDIINHYLGGHSITIKGIKQLIKNQKQSISILDIGSGGGDTLKAVAIWGREQNQKLKLIGVDLKNDCIEFAKENCIDFPEISFIQSDYRTIEHSDLKIDIIISSLFCHHLTNDEIVVFLRWMHKNSRTGFIINDLQRHPIAYQSIKLLTTLFSKSYLVKNDAKLSVARGFIKSDWENLIHKAGIKNAYIKWHWAFRHLIVVNTE
ncbi:methyltransferase domain-containing protein [Solitalea canadensis]|nr:methyltransferase domain-containing protein [Solitalea canadensis]